ncbi:MAG TPA: hypothetical protein VFS96_02220, partial [Nitrolancea sp.]|nr:hypothetical protein [Nitrolancea sp.]
MRRNQLLTLVAKLRDPRERQVTARSLARHLGADDLMLFVPDPEIEVLLPAPGFPQTLPGGQAWRTFLAKSAADGCHSGEFPFPGSSTPISALGVAAGDGSILVLLGGNPNLDAVNDVCLILPLLAAALRGEQGTLIAAGHSSEARNGVVKAKALTDALDATRRNLQQALGDARAAHHRL